MFSNWAALRKHMQGPAHSRLTVICPWCRKQERTFTRVADLKVHATKIHALEGVEDSHFGRGVGFFFSKYPEDYAKIVEEIADYSDDGACKARSLMRQWAESMPEKDKVLDKLNKGWKVEKVRKGNGEREKSQQKEQSGGAKENEGKKKAEEAGKTREDDRDRRRRRNRSGSGDRRTVVEKSAYVDEAGDRRKEKDSKAREQQRKEKEAKERQAKEKEDEIWEEAEREREKLRQKEKELRGEGGNRSAREAEARGDGCEARRKGEERRSASVENRRDEASGEVNRVERDTEQSRKRKREEEDEDREERGYKDYKDDITLTDSDSSDSDSDSSIEESGSARGTDRKGVGITNARQRATRLLRRGVMPMCPPAQRDWTTTDPFDIESKSGSLALTWPPRRWMALSPDQKLLAREHAATSLEMSRTGSFPSQLSRRCLLDKYNFLALEGEARPTHKGKASADAKARYYTFSFLSDIAKGRVSESRVVDSVLGSLEKSERWTDTDFFISKLDTLGLKLRV